MLVDIGLIGLSAVGRGAAAQLLSKTAHNLLTYDPDGRDCEGVDLCETAAEVFSKCDTIVLALDRESDLVTLCNGIAAFLRPGQILIDFTDISPALAHATANAARRQEAFYLDCGMFGAGPGLRPPLLLFVGGSSEAYAKVQSLLRCIASSCRYMGPSGRGQAGRVLSRALAAETQRQTTQMLALAQTLGMPEGCFMGFDEIAHPLAALHGETAAFSLDELESDRILAREIARRAGISD